MAWNPNIPTVTNRVQDDLDAIRHNFEALDGLPQDKTNILELAGEKDNILGHLADTNNPHNVQAPQVPYSSGVAGFSPADVAAALDALAGVRIVEMGSNINGEYVRWENGLQACWHQLLFEFTSGETNNLLVTWVFPAAFANTNYRMIGVPLTSSPRTYIFAHGGGKTTSSVNARIERSADTGNVTLLADVLAVGRWK